MKTPNTTHIRGASFKRAGYIKLPAGTWTGTSVAKDSSGLSFNLTVTLVQLGSPLTTGETHSILLENSASTSTWPITTLVADIKFTESGTSQILYTNKFNISVLEHVTD